MPPKASRAAATNAKPAPQQRSRDRALGANVSAIPPNTAIPISMAVPAMAVPISPAGDIHADGGHTDTNRNARTANANAAPTGAGVVVTPAIMVAGCADTHPHAHLGSCGQCNAERKASGQ
jgi:hypothetical protein